MRKFLLILLSILCMFCVALGVGCANGGDSSSSSVEETRPEGEIVLLNGFNKWDDMIVIYLEPATFDGSMKLNEDPQYIVEGEGSYKCYIYATKANQPNLKMSAGTRKSDITDVTEFGLYIYNDNDYAFDVIITAYAGDAVVCTAVATAEATVGNNLVFPINRAVVQKMGKVITDYSISFSGLKGDSTFYLDNFYVKTTNKEVEYSEEVLAIVNDIDSFTENTAREDLEKVIETYNALSENDKQCVTNYERLNSLIMPHWLDDLAEAQVSDPKTLLYFDCDFGPLQVKNLTPGISSYGYSTEKAYEGEDGSLKVNFAVTSTNWVSLVTTATTLIEEEFIEFYVYNDSDQYKAMCVGWKVPINAYDTSYMILNPREWTKIESKSKDLTDSGGASGAFQICGLSDLTDRRASAPDGTMYFSAVMKKSASKEIVNSRVGEDENTLLFFDRELGLQQASETGGVKEFSADTVFNGETGALKMHYVGNTSPTLGLALANYEFNKGDYVVMHVYADLVDADYMYVRLGYLNGTYCANKKWTTVLIPAEAFAEDENGASTHYLRFDAFADAGDYTLNASVKIAGDVYITKAKVYSAEQVKNMSEVDDTYEYQIGSTTFVGKINNIGKYEGSYNYNPTIFGSWHDTNVALVNGELRLYARSDSEDNATGSTRQTVIGLEFKDAVQCDGTKLYIVASGLVDDPDADDLLLQVFTDRESGHFASPRPESREVLEDGYVRYCFDLSSYAGETIKYFRLWTGHQLIIPDIEAIMIRDIYFGE